jgi:hypothetical protein
MSNLSAHATALAAAIDAHCVYNDGRFDAEQAVSLILSAFQSLHAEAKAEWLREAADYLEGLPVGDSDLHGKALIVGALRLLALRAEGQAVRQEKG